MISSSSLLRPTIPTSTYADTTINQVFLLCHISQQPPFTSMPQHHHIPHHLRIHASQTSDNKFTQKNSFIQPKKLKIAIIGFGNFGQFLAKAFIKQGHTVYLHSRYNHKSIAQTLGAAFFFDPHDLCEQHPDVILINTSIISTKSVLRSLPIQRLKRNTLFVDVLSVKEFPRDIFLHVLLEHFDILCTHPMFGSESGKFGWTGLPFVFDKIKIGNEESGVSRVESFLDVFAKEGCRMVEMSCEEHDKSAGSQFITHTIGRILEKFQLESMPINTKGYKALLELVKNTAGDSFDLYYGLFMFNKNAMEELERLDLAVEELKSDLFGQLHYLVRKQLFGKVEANVPLLHCYHRVQKLYPSKKGNNNLH